MRITQRTHLSKSSLTVSILVVALMVAAAAAVYYIDKDLAIVSALVLALLVAMCGSVLFFMPTQVQCDESALTVMFPCRYRAFRLSEIAEAAPYTGPKLMLRICGSGAFFGWWGWFSAKGEGRFMLYASNLDHLLAIRLKNGKKYVISCSDPAEISNSISGKISH